MVFSDYPPCDLHLVGNVMSHLEVNFKELQQLAKHRRDRLNESQFSANMADEEMLLEELLNGQDLTSVHLLLSKHKV